MEQRSSSTTGAEALVHEKLRAAVVDGTAVLESVTSLMQARAALELSYSKSLQKLSQLPFAFNGAMVLRGSCRYSHIRRWSVRFVVTERTIHPTVFEAIASLRGDIANEGVQHHELANSIQKEVIEPLSRLNDRNEKVQRIVRWRRVRSGESYKTRYRPHLCRAPKPSARQRKSEPLTIDATS